MLRVKAFPLGRSRVIMADAVAQDRLATLQLAAQMIMPWSLVHLYHGMLCSNARPKEYTDRVAHTHVIRTISTPVREGFILRSG